MFKLTLSFKSNSEERSDVQTGQTISEMSSSVITYRCIFLLSV